MSDIPVRVMRTNGGLKITGSGLVGSGKSKTLKGTAHVLESGEVEIRIRPNPDYVSFGRKGRGEVFHAFTRWGAKRKARKIAERTGKEQWSLPLKDLEKIERAEKAKRQNPDPSAIPAKWTPATVSRKGGQIQIRMGGR